MADLQTEVGENLIHTRGLVSDCTVRAIDEEKRTAEFVAATENGVMTWGGIEYLKMSGAKLTRFRKNPVVLDAHDSYSGGSVIGNADVKVESKNLVARVRFATTTRAEEIWQLVKDGFLRALSIGFLPYQQTIKRLAEGETDGEGEDMITGPARIIRSWELYEISVVPVPADPDAVRRASLDSGVLASLMAALGYTHIDTRLLGAEKEPIMAEKNEKPEAAPAPKGEERTVAVVEMQTPEDILRVQTIRALAPRGMEKLADKLVVENVTVEVACKRFLDALAVEAPPVGTPEPKQPDPKAKRTLADVDTRALAETLLG